MRKIGSTYEHLEYCSVWLSDSGTFSKPDMARLWWKYDMSQIKFISDVRHKSLIRHYSEDPMNVPPTPFIVGILGKLLVRYKQRKSLKTTDIRENRLSRWWGTKSHQDVFPRQSCLMVLEVLVKLSVCVFQHELDQFSD